MALNFDAGGTDYVGWDAAPLNISNYTQPFTMSAWVYVDQFRSSAFVICTIGTGDYQAASFQIWQNKLTFIADASGTGPWDVGDPAIGLSTLSISKTYHLACSRNSKGVYTVYVNGVPDGSATLASNLSLNNQIMKIGAHYALNTGYDSDGQIDDVRIYNRALTPSEIRLLAQSRMPERATPQRTRTVFYSSGLVSYLRRRTYNSILGSGVLS